MQVPTVIQVNLVNIPLAAIALPARLFVGGKAHVIIKLHPKFIFEKDGVCNWYHHTQKVMVIKHVKTIKCHARNRPNTPPSVGDNVDVCIPGCSTVMLGFQQKLQNE
jgi:hypothetical protein